MQEMRQAESKVEPKTEPFDEGDKVSNGNNGGGVGNSGGGGGGQQQSTQNQLQSQVATSQATSNASFVDTNGNSEGNEILVLVPALNANGLTTANITTDYRNENGRNLIERQKTTMTTTMTTTTSTISNDLQQTNYLTRSDNNNRNSIVTEQIVWIPKIEQQHEHGQHQATTSIGNVVCQPPPLYTRIKQLNYSQVEIKQMIFPPLNRNKLKIYSQKRERERKQKITIKK